MVLKSDLPHVSFHDNLINLQFFYLRANLVQSWKSKQEQSKWRLIP